MTPRGPLPSSARVLHDRVGVSRCADGGSPGRTPVLSGHPARHRPPLDLPWTPQSQTPAPEDSLAPLALSQPPPAPPGARGPRTAQSGAVTPLHLPEPGTSVHFRRTASRWVQAHTSGQQPAGSSLVASRCFVPFHAYSLPVRVLASSVRHHLQESSITMPVLPSRRNR